VPYTHDGTEYMAYAPRDGAWTTSPQALVLRTDFDEWNDYSDWSDAEAKEAGLPKPVAYLYLIEEVFY
jgi:hypothetical protein